MLFGLGTCAWYEMLNACGLFGYRHSGQNSTKDIIAVKVASATAWQGVHSCIPCCQSCRKADTQAKEGLLCEQ